ATALENQASGNLNEIESPKPASTVLYTQDFDNGGSIPSGWATKSILPNKHPWKMELDKGSDYSAVCTSLLAGEIREQLYMTDYIDCSGYTSLELEFYMDYKYGDGFEYAQVQYKNSTYSLFQSAQTWSGENVVGTQIVDLPYAAGDPEVRIAFYYRGTNDYYMLVDDVILRGEEQDDGDDDDDDNDGNGNGNDHKKSDDGIGGGVVNFLLSPIGLIAVGGITAALVAIVIVVWVVKKKHRR
ncbi:MAG: hypothetical protein ACFFHD_08730, partial [Promethearchaeota archaeon]